MLALSDVFSRTWGELTGPAPSQEFWRAAAEAVPHFLLLAEVYWGLEWRLQELGFHFTYDKTLYDRLLRGSGDEIRAHLGASDEYQRRSVRFIENHDEPGSVAAFGERAAAAAVAMSTLPGMRFYQDGQFEGRRARVPVQLGAFGVERADERIVVFYRRLLDAANQSVCHAGQWRLCQIRRCDETTPHLVAWRWRLDDDSRIIVVNVGGVVARGFIDVMGDLPPGDAFWFVDQIDGAKYLRTARDLASSGLFVRLDVGQAHFFRIEVER
jgi:hypothetical protein